MPALSRPRLAAATAGGVLLFGVVAALTAAGVAGGADARVFRAATIASSSAATRALQGVAFSAGPEVTVLWVAGLVVAALAMPRLRPVAGVAAVCVLAGTVLEAALKAVLVHPSPPAAVGAGDVSLLGVSQPYSFPSGHAFRITVLAAATVLCLPPAWRARAWPAAALLVAAVLYSRLALGAHWLSDVIGGAALGAAALPALVAAAPPRESGRAPVGTLSPSP